MHSFFINTLAAALLVNSFIFLNLWQAFRRGPWLYLAVPLFLLMGFLPLVNLLLDYNGTLYQSLTLLETLWLAYATPLAFILLVLDIVYIGGFGLRKIMGRSQNRKFPFKRAVRLGMLLSLPLSIYAFYEANYVLQVQNYALSTSKIPAGSHQRIVFIADMHINGRLSDKRLQRVIDTANASQPDIIILGGDIIDAPGRHKTHESDMLRQLHAPSGKFAVLGNHENSYTLPESIKFLQDAGLTLLRGEAVEVSGLNIVGVDDPIVARAEGSTRHMALPLLSTLDQNKYIILAQHRPFIQPECTGLLDLQISGHNHGGHLWPVNHLLKLTKHGLANGLSTHSSAQGQSQTIITRGTGYGRTPLRLAIPPEIVIIDLTGTGPASV